MSYLNRLFFYRSIQQTQNEKKLSTPTTATALYRHHCHASAATVAAIRWRRWSAIAARLSVISSVERMSQLYARYPTKPNTPIEMRCPPGSAFYRREYSVKYGKGATYCRASYAFVYPIDPCARPSQTQKTQGCSPTAACCFECRKFA